MISSLCQNQIVQSSSRLITLYLYLSQKPMKIRAKKPEEKTTQTSDIAARNYPHNRCTWCCPKCDKIDVLNQSENQCRSFAACFYFWQHCTQTIWHMAFPPAPLMPWSPVRLFCPPGQLWPSGRLCSLSSPTQSPRSDGRLGGSGSTFYLPERFPGWPLVAVFSV